MLHKLSNRAMLCSCIREYVQIKLAGVSVWLIYTHLPLLLQVSLAIALQLILPKMYASVHTSTLIKSGHIWPNLTQITNQVSGSSRSVGFNLGVQVTELEHV